MLARVWIFLSQVSLKLVYFGVYSFPPKIYIFYLIGCEREKSRNHYFKVYVFMFLIVKVIGANAYLVHIIS